MKIPPHGQVLLCDVCARLCSLWESGEQQAALVSVNERVQTEGHSTGTMPASGSSKDLDLTSHSGAMNSQSSGSPCSVL